MNSKQKILRHFIENNEDSFSIRSISKKLKINYRIAFEEIEKLKEQELIEIKKLGNCNLCRFAFKYNEKVFEIENIRKNELLDNKDLWVIYNRFKDIKSPFFILAVFGSYAKGTQTKRSDIDLCIIADNEKILKKAEQIIGLIPFEIHLLDFTTEQFISMLKTTELNVGKEIVKNNIILYGTENFYEMINYAKQ
ncbi:nucleotidyltransferase domain-containing protein [Candidatus Woesearchaeota archaeon]|nr:nucleotidyltransferase domain-containing protein [Candidatus Woesearchaeota archaeon]